jgi:phosphoglucosamine mutase
MGRLFGTDGVRGLANADLTAELALDLAVAAAHVLADAASAAPGSDGSDAPGAGRRLKAVVGRDPRASGEFRQPSAAWRARASTSRRSPADPGGVPDRR